MSPAKEKPSSWFEIDKSPSSLMQACPAGIDPAGKTFVVLCWAPRAEFTGYNLYRSGAGGAKPKPAGPINGRSPIEAARSCAQLKKIIPEGSREWNMLTNGFSALAARPRLRNTADAHKRGRFADQAALAAIRSMPVNPLSGNQNPKFGAETIDPCTALSRGLSAAEEDLFETLARGNLKMRLARGMAFIDRRVTAHQHYIYELRGVQKDGSEIALARNVAVWAGHFVLPDPPSGLTLSAGDHKILALWNRNPYAYSYMVQRSTNPGGPFQQVNPKPVLMDIERDIQDAPVSPPQPGYLDYQHWDADGLPESHLVNGLAVAGPENGTMYYYRAASRDVLERTGSWSSALPAMAQRSTPPMVPDEVQVSAQLAPPGLAISWRKVTRDIDNHQLPDSSQSYSIYRAGSREELENLASLPAHQVATLSANPQDPASATLMWTDTDPLLLPAYGEKTFFYRLRCSDPFFNTSAPSAAVGGHVPDTTPPGPTAPDGADGFAEHIRVYWKANTEPDLAGYQIYRGVCDRGQIYRPGKKERPTGKCDLSLVGQVSLGQAKDMLDNTGQIHFDDYSVPEGSPVCYAYWVRAFDAAQNLYQGNGGCPARREEYVCMRLLEKTPPPAPVITGLRARDRAVLVEWIGSPVQDLRAFHVYRSDKENDPPVFMACIFTNGIVQATPWSGLAPSCADIPAEPDPLTARGHYLDASAVPNQIYWYRVSALDWLGNESEGANLLKLPSSSTFSYTCDLPVTPAILPMATQAAAGCGLEVRWGPAFDATLMDGFVIFRSTSGGPYRQVSAVLAGNELNDTSARRGVDYWYRAQSIDKEGRLSEPSAAELYRY